MSSGRGFGEEELGGKRSGRAVREEVGRGSGGK